MNWIRYKIKAENLANRLENAYHKTGAEFLFFFWVHDASTFTMSFTATANFADALAGHGSTSLDNVFHAAIINNGISTNGINIWSINGSDSIKKFIVTGTGAKWFDIKEEGHRKSQAAGLHHQGRS